MLVHFDVFSLTPKPMMRKQWPKEQADAVREEFKVEIGSLECPNQKRCLEVLDRYPHCNGDYVVLKQKVNNYINTAKSDGKPRSKKMK